MFRKKIKPDNIENWKCIYETSIESEAGLVEIFLQNRGIDCQILSKKDTAYNVTFGDLSALYIYVPEAQAGEAEKAIAEWKEGKIDNENNTEDGDFNGENPDT